MRVAVDNLSFAQFERLALSGEVARAGHARKQCKVRLLAQTLQRPGAPARPVESVACLQPGERLERHWDCQMPSLARLLGLDHFVHTETFAKRQEKNLAVADAFTWPGTASVAERHYEARASEPSPSGRETLQREMGPWNVAMRGVSRLLRGRVERAMRGELAQTDVELGNILAQADAHAAA